MLVGKQKLTLCEIDAPVGCASAEIITVKAVGIGGSEYLGFNHPGIRPIPSIMGHGFTGIDANQRRVAVYPLSGCGSCQFCSNDQAQLCEQWSLLGVQTDGGFAEKVSVPRDQLFDIPDDISWEQSVFIEPFANSINAWEISGAQSKHSIAVIGAGSLGLGLVALANQSASCHRIHVSEPSLARKAAAQSLGATETSNQLNKVYDVVFDTVGSTATRNQAIQATQKGGACVFLGFETAELNVNVSEIIRYQKRIMGSFVFSKRQFLDAIGLSAVCDAAWVKNISFCEVEQTLIQFCKADFEQVKVALWPSLAKHELD